VRDAGSSSGSFALVAADLLTVAVPRLRWSLIVALMAGLAVTLTVDQRLFDLQHLISAGATVQVGISVLLPRSSHRMLRRTSGPAAAKSRSMSARDSWKCRQPS
jgi:hypothetical protein